jgi:hypothetical protein
MIPTRVAIERVQLARVLESALVLSWSDLMRASKKGLVHVEYGTAPEPSLQYLKVWLSTTKGIWDLICEYWRSSGSSTLPAAGLTFSNGYHSAHLAGMLEQMMQHREGFRDSLSGDSAVNLIQVQSPTEGDRVRAGACMTEAYDRLGLRFAPAPAAA